MKIIIIAMIFQFIHTAYFGFNWESESRAEKVCDNIFIFMMIVGAFSWGLSEGRKQ